MRTKLKIVVALIIVCIIPQISFSQQYDEKLIEKTVEKELKEKSIPGVSIGIIKDNELIYSAAFGVANTTTKLKANSEMLYRLGSTTKMFVAAAALILADQGKLDLTKPIKNYIADLPPGCLTRFYTKVHLKMKL